MTTPHPTMRAILEAHGAPKPVAIRTDLADDVSYIAAHESDPRKEEVLYEAAEALERYEASGQNETDPSIRITDHKWLDPKCVECGCQSLFLRELLDAPYGL
jgi:hypothetical protein